VSSTRGGLTPGESAAHRLARGFEGSHIGQERGDLGLQLRDLGFEVRDLGL